MLSGARNIYEEIEVTPEMIETGRDVLWSYNRENDLAEVSSPDRDVSDFPNLEMSVR